ncbi:MAG: type IX secretion system sortase PorU, partial [Flavobacteriales bacterium]
MRKYVFLFLCGFFMQITFAQVSNSVLSSGNWFQFSVDTTGIFKIDRNLLQQIGVSTNGVNPKKIHIYGNGGQMLPDLNSDFRYDDLQENAIFISGENDGSFDSNDFILFYAKGPHDWEVNTNNAAATHRQNIFSDKAYYFITVNEVDGKRISQKAPITANATSQITVFDDYTFYEKDEKSILAVGTEWFFYEDFNIENTQEFSIPFPNAVPNQNINV